MPGVDDLVDIIDGKKTPEEVISVIRLRENIRFIDELIALFDGDLPSIRNNHNTKIGNDRAKQRKRDKKEQ